MSIAQRNINHFIKENKMINELKHLRLSHTFKNFFNFSSNFRIARLSK